MGDRGPKPATAIIPIQSRPVGVPPKPGRKVASPPAHLGKPEKQIWKDVTAEYAFESNAAYAVLRTALEAHQRAREAREQIGRDGATIEGRDGQLKAHPLLSVERDARAAWLSGVKLVELEL